MFFIIVDPISKESFVVTNEGGLPHEFKTEAEAIAEAKDYSNSLIVRATARLVERSTHKVEKLK